MVDSSFYQGLLANSVMLNANGVCVSSTINNLGNLLEKKQTNVKTASTTAYCTALILATTNSTKVSSR